jgi:hypothetical protein
LAGSAIGEFLYLVASAGPPSSTALTGSPRHALGLTEFKPGRLDETALRASNHADFPDT